MSLERLMELAATARERSVKGVRRTPGEWYRISNATGGRAKVYIYGDIGVAWDGEGVTAAQFVQELDRISARAIDLHINSPGGLVFDGIAIYAALRNHPATVDVHVDGLAASAASFIAQAGDSRTMEKAAKLMIHDAAGLVIGNAKDMREMADLLDELSDTIAGIYADRAGGSVEAWREAMRHETWYSASEAIKAGLADQVAGEESVSASSRRSQMIRARARVALGRGVR